jgi:hypothetical protein
VQITRAVVGQLAVQWVVRPVRLSAMKWADGVVRLSAALLALQQERSSGKTPASVHGLVKRYAGMIVSNAIVVTTGTKTGAIAGIIAMKTDEMIAVQDVKSVIER